jgi:hypothetical protein
MGQAQGLSSLFIISIIILYVKSKLVSYVCLSVAGQRWRSFGSVPRQRPASNNGVVFSFGSVLRTRCGGKIVLL